MKLDLYTKEGIKKENKDYSDIPCFEGEKGIRALRQVILSYRANLRQGNACTKNRSEVSGTGKKPYKQKGTGMARHGSKRSPIWRKGGVVFGPKPRSYSQKINKKMKALAFSRAFFDVCSSQRVALVEEWDSGLSKTKTMSAVVRNISLDRSILLVDVSVPSAVMLASRNLDFVSTANVSDLNALDLVSFKKIILSESAFHALLSRVVR